MKSLSNYLLAIFAVMFWIFRLVVTFTDSMGIDFAIKPLNPTFEIALLFITVIAIIFIMKRKMLGAIIYLFSYGAYFGVDVYNTVMKIIEGETGLRDFTQFAISFLAIILAIAVFFDVLVTRDTKNGRKDKKTDWFYKNKDFDRVLDERADKNNYRIG